MLQSDIKGCTICNTIIGTKKGTISLIKSGTKNTSDQNTNVVCGGGYIEKYFYNGTISGTKSGTGKGTKSGKSSTKVTPTVERK